MLNVYRIFLIALIFLPMQIPADTLPDSNTSDIVPVNADQSGPVNPDKSLWVNFDEDQIPYIKNNMESADHTYDLGFYMASGGLAGLLVSSYLPPVGTIGGLAFMVGLPVMGNGASQANSLAKKMIPAYRDPGSGWGYYGAGMGLTYGGSIWLVYELIQNMGVAFVGHAPIPTVSSTDPFILPLATIFSGVICQAVSWHKFSARHRAAHSALRHGIELSLNSGLREKSGFLSGMVLTGRF